MVDANMGGGPPPPPPGAAGFVMNEVDTINKKKTRQSPYGPQVFNIDTDRGKRGGPRPGPPPDMPAYETNPPIQQIPSGGGRAGKIKQTKNDKKISITKGKRGKKKDDEDMTAPPPAPAPAPPPAPAPAGTKILNLPPGATIDKKTGKMKLQRTKTVKKGANSVKSLNGLPTNPPVEPTPIPAPAVLPPDKPPTLKIRLIGKQKKPPNTTKAEKKQAAIDALAAAKAAADTATILLPDTPPKALRASVKRKPQAGDPPEPDPTEPAAVKIRKAAVAKITKPKAIAKPKRPPSTAEAVQTTASKRGPGPDDQPGKKVKQEPTRKRGKPEDDPTAAAEEEPRLGVTPTGGMTIIKAPGKITVEELITKVRYAIKNNLLSEELRKAYLAIGLQLADQAKDINKKDEKSLKDIYRQGVWNKAKGQAPGGGRYSAVY
jgi:hypothetical protein